jgi:hypothetical protein
MSFPASTNFARAFLNVSLAAVVVWIVGMTTITGFTVWAAYFAKPAIMSEGSLSQTSSGSQKLFHITSCVGMVLFGFAYLVLVMRIRRRIASR